jgi:ribosomal protein S6--L-glutamate ligase
VTIIGDGLISYWRICGDPGGFYGNLSKGGKIDRTGDLRLKEKAESLVLDFCRSTGINLAGLDVIFSDSQGCKIPFLLEINYFFGRAGLGGSEEYYRILKKAIRRWLKTILN